LLDEPDVGHVVVVMTHPSPRSERLFGETMRSLHAAGIGRHNFFVVSDSKHEGQAKTFFRAMRLAREIRGFRRMTLFEDDVVVARNMIDYAARVRLDRIALVAWYTPHWPFAPIVGPGLLLRPAKLFWGNQGITMPASTVHALLDSPECRDWSEPH